jgi:type IV pilus assembly protein PilE
MRRIRGFTLVEAVIALGVVALLVGLALPSWQSRLAAARRGDATAALERLLAAQERHRTQHGRYADDLRALGIPSVSSEGLYDLRLETGPGERYVAVAQARADGPQADDTPCPALVLHVQQGFATRGPSLRCWNR